MDIFREEFASVERTGYDRIDLVTGHWNMGKECGACGARADLKGDGPIPDDADDQLVIEHLPSCPHS